MYDSRFSGYGDPRRTYYDPVIGANKYFYDDVDAIRMPQYITRNKLDSVLTPFGNAYGNVMDGAQSLDDVRQRAQQAWFNNSTEFRESLSKALMRKNNEQLVQRRLAPRYSTNGGGRFVSS